MAKRKQMLNICRKARGWDLIVRTPKLTYFPKKKISQTGNRVVLGIMKGKHVALSGRPLSMMFTTPASRSQRTMGKTMSCRVGD